MNVSRYVNLGFALMALITWVVMAEFFGWGFELINPDWDLPILGYKFTLSNILGIGAGIGVWIWLKVNPKISTWANEVANELKKVTWPGWKDTRASTVVVIITSIVVALILGLFDYIWGALTSLIYNV